MKALADNKIKVVDWVENIVGKGENAGYQYFLLFPQCFQTAFTRGRKKSGLCGKELNHLVSPDFPIRQTLGLNAVRYQNAGEKNVYQITIMYYDLISNVKKQTHRHPLMKMSAPLTHDIKKN